MLVKNIFLATSLILTQILATTPVDAVDILKAVSAVASGSWGTGTPANGIANGGWNSGGQAPEWIRFDLGRYYKAVESVSFLQKPSPCCGLGTYTIKSCPSLGSCAGGTQIGYFSNSITAHTWMTIPVTATVAAPVRYIEIYVSSQAGSWVTLDRIYMTIPTLTQTPSLTPTLTATPEFTKTREPGLLLQDGASYSGVVKLADTKPLEGDSLTATEYTDRPAGYTCTSGCHRNVVLIEDYVWFIPYSNNDHVVRMHRHTGMTSGVYNTWPGAVTMPTLYKFGVAAYDKARGRIWMAPCAASHVVWLDVNTGNTDYCPTWPAGYSYTGSWQFVGGFVERDYFWLSPNGAYMLVRVDMRDCAMRGFNSWPTGVTNVFSTAVFDGDHHGWYVPTGSGNIPMKMNVWTEVMTPYPTWPSGYSVSGTYLFRAGAFDGQRFWMGPWSANMIVSLDQDTGTMTGYNSWPATGFSLGSAATIAANFDGMYIWIIPRDCTHFIRVEATSGTMAFFAKTNLMGSLNGHSVIDFQISQGGEGGMWLCSDKHIFLLRWSTQTQTDTPIVTDTLTKTEEPTGSQTSSAPATATQSATVTPADTETHMPTATASQTPTVTPVQTATREETPTPEKTATVPLPTPVPPTPSPPTPVPPPPTPVPTAPPIVPHASTSSLSLAASHTAHWTALFEVSANATSATTATNVTLEVSVMAAVILSLDGNYSTCAQSISSARGGKGTVFCTIESLPVGQTVSIFVMVNSSLKYSFNGIIVLRYTLQADNGDSALVGKLKMLPSSYTDSAVTAAPGPGNSPGTSNNNNGRGVFGQGEGVGRCIDAFVFTTFGSLVLIGVVTVLTLMCLKKKEEEEEKQHAATSKQRQPNLVSEEDDDVPNAAPPPLGPVNTCVAIPLWRSLALQHAYCIVPCHSQCALNHTLPLVMHVFTLMMLCATISSTFLTSDVSGVTITVVLSVLMACGLRPLIVQMYYFRFSWPHEFHDRMKSRVSSTNTPGGGGTLEKAAGEKLKRKLSPVVQAEPEAKLQLQKSLVGLENVTLLEEDVGRNDSSGEEEEFEDVEKGHTKKSMEQEEEEEEQGRDEHHQQQQPSNSPPLEDDIVCLEKDQSNNRSKNKSRSQEVQENSSSNHTTTNAAVGGTIHRLGEQEAEAEENQEDVGDITFADDEERRRVFGDVDDVGEAGSDGIFKDAEVSWMVKSVVTPHRNKGHLLVLTVLILVAIIALSVILSIQTSTRCSAFELSFLISLLADFVVVQPLIVSFTYLYRWLQSDEDDRTWSELHPFDGEEREM